MDKRRRSSWIASSEVLWKQHLNNIHTSNTEKLSFLKCCSFRLKSFFQTTPNSATQILCPAPTTLFINAWPRWPRLKRTLCAGSGHDSSEESFADWLRFIRPRIMCQFSIPQKFCVNLRMMLLKQFNQWYQKLQAKCDKEDDFSSGDFSVTLSWKRQKSFMLRSVLLLNYESLSNLVYSLYSSI